MSTSFLRVIPEEQRSNIFTGWGCWKGSQQGRHRGSHCRFVPQWWGDGGRGRGQLWEALWCCFPTLGGLITWFQKSITCQHNRCTERSANSNAETGGSTIRKRHLPPLSVDIGLQSAYVEPKYTILMIIMMIQFVLRPKTVLYMPDSESSLCYETIAVMSNQLRWRHSVLPPHPSC